MKNKITMNIGISLFLCVFVILCLVTFAVLSVTSAKSHMNVTEKSVEHAEAYYALSSEGERTLKQVETYLSDCYRQTESQAEYEEQIRGLTQLVPDSRLEGRQFAFRIRQGEQELLAEIEIMYPGDYLYRVTAWKVVPVTDWEPDAGMDIL